MNLPTNLFDGNVNIQTFLCQPNKEIIGEIIPYNYNATFKFNSYSEISFTIDRYYNDLFEGVTKVNPYYKYIESLRVIYLRGIGHFIIQDVDEDISDNESKSVTCFSLEYTTGQKYLENFYVNTGEESSIEVMHNAQFYGVDYDPSNDQYIEIKVGSDKFDPYQRYYIKKYEDRSWNAVEQQVLDAAHFETFIGENSETTLYIKKYQNVRFYWPTKPELSLLHHVFDRIPEWEIGHVDKDLWYQERTFSEDRTAVYDFLYNTAAETLKFVMVWDSVNGTCSFYKTTEDGMTTDNYVRTNTYNPGFVYYSDTKGTEADPQPQDKDEVVNRGLYINIGKAIDTQWNTDVFISRENLASALDIQYSTDDIKTKLKITGSEGLDVRDVNLGQNYILNLDYYIPKNEPSEWVSARLQDKYINYSTLLTTNTAKYQELVAARSAAYNEYSDLMYYVPVEPRVMLIGDEFEKLYCTYGKYKRTTQYSSSKTYYTYDKGKYIEVTPSPSKEDVQNKKNYYYVENVTTQVDNLRTKLATYRVDQNDEGTKRSSTAKTDDVLLTLENSNSDSVTIRVRHNQDDTSEIPDKSQYMVYRTLTSASTGVSNTLSYPIEDWVEGNLTASKLGLTEDEVFPPFTIKSIGTLGAYFCLVRDETNVAELEDYGIKLLQEKQETYTKIFITQTEGYMNKESSQCIASNEEPEGDEYPVGTKWLNTDETDNGNLIMKIRTNDGWSAYTPESNDYENYARFYENYIKLGNVQTVLNQKQLQADYLLDGVAITDRYITNSNINFETLSIAATSHFQESLVDAVYDEEFRVLSFKIDPDKENTYAAYVIDGVPYVAYLRSQGVSLAKMNVLKEASDMNKCFSQEDIIALSPFIREDEFSDDNFLLTSYESEEEEMNIKQELLKAGDEELKKICQPKLSFSATMGNILAMPEFTPLRSQFKLGNFIRVGIREGYVKRARLLEVQINLDDPSDFSATFGDLISTKSEIDKHALLLEQAVTAGKSVASNQSKWQKGADKATELDDAINNGLRDAALSIGSADGQNITWNKYGIRGRKLIDGTTDQYYDEQFALINNKLAFTTDNWKTSRAVVGEFEVERNVEGKKVKQTMYGLLADAMVGGYIQGAEIVGGTLQIGDGSDNYFQVDKSGNVQIVQAGKEKYATTSALENIKNAYQYSVRLAYEGSTIITGNETAGTVITASVYKDGEDITSTLGASKFNWKRSSGSSNESDEAWNNNHKGQKTVTITHNDVDNSTHFWCEVDI